MRRCAQRVHQRFAGAVPLQAMKFLGGHEHRDLAAVYGDVLRPFRLGAAYELAEMRLRVLQGQRPGRGTRRPRRAVEARASTDLVILTRIAHDGRAASTPAKTSALTQGLSCAPVRNSGLRAEHEREVAEVDLRSTSAPSQRARTRCTGTRALEPSHGGGMTGIDPEVASESSSSVART
jgi:hypothetical protein